MFPSRWGSTNGDAIKWPEWLPIRINQIGLTWPDIEKDPSDFQLVLSAEVTGLHSLPFEFSGSIQGIRIDIGKLIKGEFPIVGIDAIGVGIKGEIFGGELKEQLIGGILKLDAAGNVLDALDTTAVADRVFFLGLDGSFSMPGLAGYVIQLAFTELGPLGVLLSVSTPQGILIHPPTGLTINDFTASVEFFRSLPSITDPFALRGESSSAPRM